MTARLSICMIARDEAEHLPRCLASVADVATEVVLVDTGSCDPTPELAAAAGARVLRAEWRGDFSAARNLALDAAKGDWCLVLDADEELPEPTRAALAAQLELADAAGHRALSVVMRNLNPPGDLAAWHEFTLVRLFRRDPRFRYEGTIHEQITPSIVRAGGRVGATGLRIVHHGYARKTAQGSVDRAQRNLEALERALRAAPADAYLRYQLGATLKALGDTSAASHLERALALDAAAPEGGALSVDARAGARMKLAQLALARGDDATAADEARLCLTLDPGNVPALQILAVTGVALGRLTEARDALRTLLASPCLAPANRGDLERLLRALAPPPRPD